jgi:hypothetical protein
VPQSLRSRSQAHLQPGQGGFSHANFDNVQIAEGHEEQEPEMDASVGLELDPKQTSKSKQRASSGWYRNGKIEQQAKQTFFQKRNERGSESTNVLRVNGQK